jgi:hypothetical protein
MDPRELLLAFMALATDNSELSLSIVFNRDEYLEKIQIIPVDWLQEPEHHSHDHPHNQYFTGVPDTVSEVKGRMVYAQTPTDLQLAWRVCFILICLTK